MLVQLDMSPPSLLLLLLPLVQSASWELPRGSPIQDYCDSETFRPRCQDDEVIVIRSASYGRHEIGRCVEQDFGYVGCVHDVRVDVDALCSGRRTCDVFIDDTSFRSAEPCHKDLKSHLRVSYSCLTVTTPPAPCSRYPPPPLTTPSGVLASLTTELTGCGSMDQPWVVTASPGQKINLTLLDFSYNGSVAGRDGSVVRTCKVYATIRETDAVRSTTVCGGTKRQTDVFSSLSHSLQVRVVNPAQGQTKPKFLLTYTFSGCADPPPPVGGWVKRAGGRAYLGCTDQRTPRWTLHCLNGNVWNSTYGNCSQDRAMASVFALPYGVSVVMVVAIAAAVSVLILVIGVVCLKWRQQRNARRQQASGLPPPTYDTMMAAPKDPGMDSGKAGPVLPHRASSLHPPPPDGQRENEYAGMRLVRGAPSTGGSYISHLASNSGGYSQGGAVQFGPGYFVHGEHIYESPDVLAREYGGTDGSRSPQYFDIDPVGVRPGDTHMHTLCGHVGPCTCAATPRDAAPVVDAHAQREHTSSNSYSY